jgi:hypothetical protein
LKEGEFSEDVVQLSKQERGGVRNDEEGMMREGTTTQGNNKHVREKRSGDQPEFELPNKQPDKQRQ